MNDRIHPEIPSMNPAPQPTFTVTTYVYDARDRLVRICEPTPDPGGAPVAHPDPPPEPLPPYTFEHDPDKGVFRLRWSDGEVEVFRDKPARHLVVAPDPQTGAIMPVLK